MKFEWDPDKADANFRKHGVQFSTEVEGVFGDDVAISITDDESGASEERFIAIGMGLRRPVSWSSSTLTAATIRGTTMKDRYDFSKGKRGRIVPEPPLEKGKVKITIRLDEDLIDQFGAMADASGGSVGYQTLINQALREYLEGKAPKFEDTLRRIVREELRSI